MVLTYVSIKMFAVAVVVAKKEVGFYLFLHYPFHHLTHTNLKLIFKNINNIYILNNL